MKPPSDLTAGALVQIAVLATLLAVSGSIWYVALQRWLSGQPLIRLSRRRPVPWLGKDVLMVVFVGVALSYLASLAASAWGPPNPVKPTDAKRSTDHPAEQLMRTRDPGRIALVAVMAVVVAPAFEEFIFRVLLQGWLEAVWSRARRKRREWRAAPMSWTPLVLPAALFALMHFRTASAPQSSDYLSRAFLMHMAAEVATIALAVGFLRAIAGAKAADFGWAPRMLGQDARLALAALIAAMPALLVLNLALAYAFERNSIRVAPDPIPLFFLALVFGLLYRRTHRIGPSLVMHAAFNATSLGLFFLHP